MKYFPFLVLLAVAGCAEHHNLTECKGPYLALLPSQPSVAEAAPASAAKAPPTVVMVHPATTVPPATPAQQTAVAK